MEKTWFIFQSDHHLGPFSTEEVSLLLESGEIDEHSPLWREGIDDWYALSEFEEFAVKGVEEILPELPDLPDTDLEHESPPDLPSLPELPEEEIEAPRQVEVHTPQIFEEEDVDEEFEFPTLPELPEYDEVLEVEPEDLPGIPLHEDTYYEEPYVEELTETFEPVEEVIIHREPLEKIDDEVGAETYVHVDESWIEGSSREAESSTEKDDVWTEIDSQVGKQKTNYKLITAVASCIIILVVSGVMIFQSTRSYVNLDGLSAITIERIEEIKSIPFSNGVMAEVFMTKDSKELVLVSNIPDQSKVYLTLSSVQGKVISDEKIVVTSVGMYTGGIAKYNEFKIVKGNQFASGEYYVQMLSIPAGVKQRVLTFLYSKFSFQLFKPAEQVRFRGKSLLFPGSQEDFSRSISEYKAKLLKNNKRPYELLSEGYKTFATLANRIYRTYEEVLTSIRSGKEIESFEILYSKEMGPILQGLITETHGKMKSYELSDPKISAKFEELLEQGKRIGEMASDMATMTKKSKRLRKESRNRLLKLFLKRSLFLQETSKAKTFEVEAELKKL